jgi:hypothetical protein
MAVITRETFALPTGSIAQTFVGTLGIIVSSVIDHVASSVYHQRKSLGRSKRVNSRTRQHDIAPVSHGKRTVQITLGTINVRLSKRTGSQ